MASYCVVLYIIQWINKLITFVHTDWGVLRDEQLVIWWPLRWIMCNWTNWTPTYPGLHTACFIITHQERRKALKSGGSQTLNRIVLYGKNLIPMEKLQNLGGPGPLVPTPMRIYQSEICPSNLWGLVLSFTVHITWSIYT